MSKPIFSITHSLDINKELTNEIFMAIIIACKTEYATTAEEDAALNACKINYDVMIDDLAKKAFKTGQKIGKKFGEVDCEMSVPVVHVAPTPVVPVAQPAG